MALQKLCQCGNDEFTTFQTIHMNVTVNADNEVEDDEAEIDTGDVYLRDTPDGPWTCTKCHEEHSSLEI